MVLEQMFKGTKGASLKNVNTGVHKTVYLNVSIID